MIAPTQMRWMIRTIVRNVTPAYLFPAVVVSINARFIPNNVTSKALARAAYSTIAVPSALAALLVTVVMCSRSHLRTPNRSAFRVAAFAAVRCFAIAAVLSLALVTSGLFDSRLFLDSIPSATIGGAIAAIQTTRALDRVRSSER
jgi:hypothetical protein